MFLLETHDETPGTCYQDTLMGFGGFAGFNEMDLNESSDSSGHKSVKFRGKFQEANAVNKNKRMYSFDVLDTNVKRLSDCVVSGGLVGELDHPTDSIIHFSNASHKITKLWWEGNVLMGEGQILDTPSGKILKSLINNGVRVGISSRGVGNGKVNEDGILVIGESYKLITFDAVADPSTNAAFQEKVVSNKREAVEPPKETLHSKIKNEGSGININKELLIACLGGIVRKQAHQQKARLSNG